MGLDLPSLGKVKFLEIYVFIHQYPSVAHLELKWHWSKLLVFWSRSEFQHLAITLDGHLGIPIMALRKANRICSYVVKCKGGPNSGIPLGFQSSMDNLSLLLFYCCGKPPPELILINLLDCILIKYPFVSSFVGKHFNVPPLSIYDQMFTFAKGSQSFQLLLHHPHNWIFLSANFRAWMLREG